MFAGVPGRGAEDAWYATAIDMELAQVQGEALVGGSIDLFKCFDQIIRPLMYIILIIGGFPLNILTAYANYHDSCSYYFFFANHVGKPHKHPCGIPQGCPLSMVLVAFLTRPWHVMVTSR